MRNKQFDLYEGIEFTEEEKKFFSEQEKLSKLIIQMVKRRVELNLSQRDLAKLSGIKQPMIARIERMDSIPRLDTIIKLFDALDLNLMVAINNR